MNKLFKALSLLRSQKRYCSTISVCQLFAFTELQNKIRFKGNTGLLIILFAKHHKIASTSPFQKLSQYYLLSYYSQRLSRVKASGDARLTLQNLMYL
ncbi:hypothetical protein CDAR_222961 [Caerostris darwini]|uniref:Uncharacterized protein n=1 Tax=Caerostris darwini TaxID=1538125 RepID=A0AAV4RMT5_9ARAC|nr:hypothetical protein CDAR_222961 [Caerostris darwini]